MGFSRALVAEACGSERMRGIAGAASRQVYMLCAGRKRGGSHVEIKLRLRTKSLAVIGQRDLPFREIYPAPLLGITCDSGPGDINVPSRCPSLTLPVCHTARTTTIEKLTAYISGTSELIWRRLFTYTGQARRNLTNTRPKIRKALKTPPLSITASRPPSLPPSSLVFVQQEDCIGPRKTLTRRCNAVVHMDGKDFAEIEKCSSRWRLLRVQPHRVGF